MSQGSRPTIIITDTDVHGFTCGVCALRTVRTVLPNVSIFSHFSTNPQEPSTTPTGLPLFIESLGNADLMILDIPVDIRNPKRYVDALINHASMKGRVTWLDHHGHSAWVDVLARNGVFVAVYGSSYDLGLAVPRMYGRVDSFVEQWALLGAVADFDTTVKDKVPLDLEEIICDIVDQAWKTRREQLLALLGGAPRPELGNCGQVINVIVERGIEAQHFIDYCRELVRPFDLIQHNVVGQVVYSTQLPPTGLAWKMAWKLCLRTGAKVAVLPTFNPRTQQYAVIFATYWRAEDKVRDIVEQYVQQRFTGRQIVGHYGARSVALISQNEIQYIPEWARELNDLIEREVYEPKVTHLISDRYVARAIRDDMRAILQKLTEVLEAQKKMYEEYLELKRRQVQLLEQATREQRERYD